MTIYDIAEKAGVSITTVSRVINNKENVNRKTREHVLAVLAECGYTPSQLARGLASKNSKTIGVLSVDIRDIHHSTIAYQVEQTLSTLGYSSIQCNFSGRQHRLTNYLNMLISRQVDGILFIGSVFSDGSCREQLMNRIDGSFPTVFINGELPLPGSYSVIEQEEEACGMVVEYFRKTRRHIGFIGVDEHTRSEQMKLRGFRAAMERAGLIPKLVSLAAARSIQGGIDATAALLSAHPETDAILYSDDITAVGGVKALLQAGIRIPEEVAVFGFNSSLYAEISTPSLSSVNNKMHETGRIAATLLVDVIGGKEREKRVDVPCELCFREST